jgi:hypothetical protein
VSKADSGNDVQDRLPQPDHGSAWPKRANGNPEAQQFTWGKQPGKLAEAAGTIKIGAINLSPQPLAE